MDDFDPVPPVNPFFKGLVIAVLSLGVALVMWVGIALIVLVTVGAKP